MCIYIYNTKATRHLSLSFIYYSVTPCQGYVIVAEHEDEEARRARDPDIHH